MRGLKKSDSIEVRLPFATKRAFMERCRAEGLTASEAVRLFIEGQVGAAPIRRRRFVRPIAGLVAAGSAAVVLALVPITVATAQDDLRSLFTAMDRNGDGTVTSTEYGSKDGPSCCGKFAAYALPLERTSKAHGLTGKLRPFGFFIPGGAFADADTDHDGKLSLAEYTRQTTQALRAGFDKLDRNHDGMISRAEHAQTYRIGFVGEPAPFAPLSELDSNSDGKVAWSEFLA